jgi:hypothetical protein
MTSAAIPFDAAPKAWRSDFEIDLSVEKPADGIALAAAALVAVFADFALRAPTLGLAVTMFFDAIAVGLLASRRLANPQARALVAIVVLFAPWFTLRASPWLLVPDLLVCLALVAMAASCASDGDLFDLSIPEGLVRAFVGALHALAAPAFAWSLFAGRRRAVGRWGAVARGGLLAVPVVGVLAVLLASADPVFASLFRFSTSVPSVILHGVLLTLGFWGMAALLRLASARRATFELVAVGPRLGTTEATTIVGALVALFSVFAAVQVVAAAGGARHVLSTRGLTYAEYARSGFFQLLAVAALTLLVLMAIRAAARNDDQLPAVLVGLCELAVALTLVIVAVALRRLGLYQAAYGLTMLRLYSFIAAGWIAATFVLLAASIGGVARHRNWFLGMSAAVALVVALGLNVVNPEAYVVRHNLHRAQAGHRVDPAYLAGLSDDAVPGLLASAVPAPDACVVPRAAHGWASFNVASRAAEKARSRRCR